jgi:enolase-phosphatase E1
LRCIERSAYQNENKYTFMAAHQPIATMTKYFCDRADVLLLDIEGTTTPVDFVFGVLFPFARTHVESFLQTHHQDKAVQADLKRLWQEYEADVAQGLCVPEWKDNQVLGAVPYIRRVSRNSEL